MTTRASVPRSSMGLALQTADIQALIACRLKHCRHWREFARQVLSYGFSFHSSCWGTLLLCTLSAFQHPFTSLLWPGRYIMHTHNRSTVHRHTHVMGCCLKICVYMHVMLANGIASEPANTWRQKSNNSMSSLCMSICFQFQVYIYLLVDDLCTGMHVLTDCADQMRISSANDIAHSWSVPYSWQLQAVSTFGRAVLHANLPCQDSKLQETASFWGCRNAFWFSSELLSIMEGTLLSKWGQWRGHCVVSGDYLQDVSA